jgi:hypothetical protein
VDWKIFEERLLILLSEQSFFRFFFKMYCKVQQSTPSKIQNEETRSEQVTGNSLNIEVHIVAAELNGLLVSCPVTIGMELGGQLFDPIIPVQSNTRMNRTLEVYKKKTTSSLSKRPQYFRM